MESENFEMQRTEDGIFALVKKDSIVRVVCGNFVVSQKEFDSFESALDYVNSKPYEIILNSALALLQMSNSKN